MDFLQQLLDLFLHLDTHLSAVVGQFGMYTYVLLFVIIFLETGLVVMPFLPGDSLLFAAGAFTAEGALSAPLLLVILTIAAILGDTVNYWIGKAVGPRVFSMNSRFLKRKYLERTRIFYEVHGSKTIVLARFIPIIRTFAPFVAGVGEMHYARFLLYNVFGGVLWVFLFVLGGNFFGSIPIVKENFEYVILAIIFLSMLPAMIEYLRHRFGSRVRP